MPKYTVSLKVTGSISREDAQRGAPALLAYSEVVFKDLVLKLGVLQARGNVKGGRVNYKAINDDTIEADYSYTATADNEELAASEAYDWILAWKNAHGVEPEVNVTEVSTFTPETLQNEPQQATEPKRMGRPPLNKDASNIS